MTQDEIIRMAKESGAVERYFGNQLHGIAFHKKEWLERFAALVAEPCIETNKALAKEIIELNKQAEQEPVYWEVRNGICKHGVYRTEEQAEEVRFDMQKSHDLSGSFAAFNIRPLYAAPVRTKDLTDDEIGEVWVMTTGNIGIFARAVIAADREKNKC